MLRLNLDGYTEDQVLRYVLLGLEADRDAIQNTISEIKSQLAGSAPKPRATPTRATPPAAPKSRMSAEGRARIAAAQRKRWAAAKKTARKATKVAKPARTRGARVNLVAAEAEPEQSAE